MGKFNFRIYFAAPAKQLWLSTARLRKSDAVPSAPVPSVSHNGTKWKMKLLFQHRP
jgi:hypothetical protein